MSAPAPDATRALALAFQAGYASYSTEEGILSECGIAFEAVEDWPDADTAVRVEAVLLRQASFGAAEMDRFPVLRIVQRYGVGVDNIDLGAAADRRIVVSNTPDYGQSQEVSDHALALYLALSRRLTTRSDDVRAGRWDIGQLEPIQGNAGRTLGVVGFGRIARATWLRFQAIGFGRCLVSDPALDATHAEALGVGLVPVADLCRDADVISLHCPLVEATRHIIGTAELQLMRPTAFVINVSRGGLIDEDALAVALVGRQIAGAGLDVFEIEPPDPHAPLMSAPDVIMTDHMAWYSEASVARLQSEAVNEVARILTGMRPRFQVN